MVAELHFFILTESLGNKPNRPTQAAQGEYSTLRPSSCCVLPLTTVMMDAESESESESSLEQQAEDFKDEQGWEDVEPEREMVRIESLFDDKIFRSAHEMFQHSKDKYNFDIWQLKQRLRLEFFDLIKLVNYTRSQVKAGNLHPDVSSKSCFEDDGYLKPVLEDDALLYSLDDVFPSEPVGDWDPLQAEVGSLREQLSQLQSQFTAYRVDVQQNLLQNLSSKSTEPNINGDLTEPSSSSAPKNQLRNNNVTTLVTPDSSYFSSYSHPSIHRTMINDTIRTDTYRDFIYDNKHLFDQKTVLDVGCGTGILSMFCAKAGAKQVIAVDNSDIIQKARENMFKNGLDGQVRCIKGKVEELDALVDEKVDVIISEWMGYCLLYESMLDSVIYARDKYLKPGGLMVPSHAKIMIAPLADSDVRVEQVDFWRDVYGFDMSGMLEHAFDEVLIQSVDRKEVLGKGVSFRELDLHTVRVDDLSFSAPFELRWEEGMEKLEGWVVWFDMFFATGREEKILQEVVRKTEHEEGAKTFSTGPFSKQTHWYQGVLLMKEPVWGIEIGQTIKGVVTYTKAGDGERSLDIEVSWEVPRKGNGKQTWKLE